MGTWLVRLFGIQVVSALKYLGALSGDVSMAQACEKSVSTFESRCLCLSRMPLFAEEQVELVHTWCYPVCKSHVCPPPPLGVFGLPSGGHARRFLGRVIGS